MEGWAREAHERPQPGRGLLGSQVVPPRGYARPQDGLPQDEIPGTFTNEKMLGQGDHSSSAF